MVKTEHQYKSNSIGCFKDLTPQIVLMENFMFKTLLINAPTGRITERRIKEARDSNHGIQPLSYTMNDPGLISEM